MRYTGVLLHYIRVGLHDITYKDEKLYKIQKDVRVGRKGFKRFEKENLER